MLMRSSVALLTAFSLVIFVLPARAMCRDSKVGDKLTKAIEGSPRQPLPKAAAEKAAEENDCIHGDNQAQHTAWPVDPRSEHIKRTVKHIGVGSKITVFLTNGDDLHGAVTSIDEERFQVAEVDLHRVVTAEYKDVTKVRRGYGGMNLFTGRRASYPSWVKIVAITGVLLLIAWPIIILAESRD
ncbi:MAG TPA: hypothetical protein VJX67_06185 [Blastocatellia bacterium]|nr:hypothetical protein [Blastocatellia bacterium]